MIRHLVKVKSIQHITHDVLQIVTEKPPKYDFIPGQATIVSINRKAGSDMQGPFTFTSLPESDVLEFTIKTYPSHKGITNEFLQLKPNDELILHEVFGSIAYRQEGLFIAGGAGITPFISIFRSLKSRNETGNNRLIFANKTRADIILEQEFKELLGDNFINILSDEETDGYEYGQITEEFLKSRLESSYGNVYICGPPPMMVLIEKFLLHLNVPGKQIVKEAF